MTILTFVLIIVILALGFRTFFMWSDRFRAKYYHKLTPQLIDQITSQPQECWYTVGVVVGRGKHGVAALNADGLNIRFDDQSSINLPLGSIKKAEVAGIGWLSVFPVDAKRLALANDGRIGLFFGSSELQKLYGLNMPFSWQPWTHSVRNADRIAQAFLAKIKQLQN